MSLQQADEATLPLECFGTRMVLPGLLFSLALFETFGKVPTRVKRKPACWKVRFPVHENRNQAKPLLIPVEPVSSSFPALPITHLLPQSTAVFWPVSPGDAFQTFLLFIFFYWFVEPSMCLEGTQTTRCNNYQYECSAFKWPIFGDGYARSASKTVICKVSNIKFPSSSLSSSSSSSSSLSSLENHLICTHTDNQKLNNKVTNTPWWTSNKIAAPCRSMNNLSPQQRFHVCVHTNTHTNARARTVSVTN